MDRGPVGGLVTTVRRLGGKKWDIYLVALLYVAMTIAMTYPVAFRLSFELAGFDHQDSFEHLWMLWWGKKAIVDLHTSLANSTFIYYPLKIDHPMLAVEPYTKLVTIPLVMAFGPLVAYNLHFLASFVLTAFSAYLLCRYLTKNSLASFVGGLIFAFFPHRVAHATGPFIQIMIYWYPLWALSLFLLLKKPTTRNALLGGVLLALSLLVGLMHIAYFVIPFTLLFLVYNYLTSRDELLNPLFQRGLVMTFGIAAILTAPFFLPFILDKLSGGLTYLARGGTIQYSADLWAFFVPSAQHPILSRIEALRLLGERVIHSYRGSFLENTVYIGIIPFLLSLWAAMRNPKRMGFWVILALASAILALGPLLKAGGQLVRYNVEQESSYIVLPYTLVKSLPFYEMGRTPARLTETTMFAVAVLASHGTALVLERWRSQRVQVFLSGCLALLILFEYLSIFPFPTGGKGVPAFYRDIARDSQDYALLDLPIGPRITHHYATYYQTVHQHKIVSGHIYRVPLVARVMLRFLGRLLGPTSGADIVAAPTDEERLAVLNYSNIRYVVVHKSVMAAKDPGSEKVMASFLRSFLGQAIYEDDKIIVFPVPTTVQGGKAPLALLTIGENWYAPEVIEGTLARWVSNQAQLYMMASVGQRYRLAFAALSFHQPRHLEVLVDGQAVSEFEIDTSMQDWATNEFALRENWGVVRFQVREGCQKPTEVLPASGDGRCLSVLFQGVRLIPVEAGETD